MDILPLDQYDKILISLSGGKDSIAMTLHMLEQGIPTSKIELMHQAVDGMWNTHRPFFDWPSTEGYVRRFAEHLNIPLSWQWRAFGIYGELYRTNQRAGDIYYRNDEEMLVFHLPTTKGTLSTRRRFPMKTASLRTRWCSASAKVDVCRRVISNRADLKGNTEKPMKLLFLTGERREESAARAKYKTVEAHPSNSKSRLVHHLRPVIEWKEHEIWGIIEKHRILPHPAYYCGFSRLSCRSCIFFSPHNWRTLKDISPDVISMLRSVEDELQFTIDNKFTLDEMIKMGESRITDENRHYIPQVVSDWDSPVTTADWQLPAGAFSGNGGGA